MKWSSWENLQPGREGISSLRKNDKGKNNQKTESEKVRFRSLEGREFGGQLSKDALEWKVSKRLLEKKSTKRRKLWEIRKGPATKVASTAWVLVPRGAKERSQWYPRTLEWHYKKGKQPTVEGHSAIMNQNIIIEKTLLKNSRKVVKEREILSGIPKQPL